MEQWNSVGGTVWWNSGTVKVEQYGGMLERWNSVGGIVKQCWLNSGTVIGEQCGGTVEKCWWNSDGGTVEQ